MQTTQCILFCYVSQGVKIVATLLNFNIYHK